MDNLDFAWKWLKWLIQHQNTVNSCIWPSTSRNPNDGVFIISSSYSSLSLTLSPALLSQCKQTQLSSLLPHHALAPPTQWVNSQSAACWALSIAITTGRQAGRQESVVVRVPLWSSGLVTLPGQLSMHCKSVRFAPSRLLSSYIQDEFYYKK